jgi:hypothetical protein
VRRKTKHTNKQNNIVTLFYSNLLFAYYKDNSIHTIVEENLNDILLTENHRLLALTLPVEYIRYNKATET